MEKARARVGIIGGGGFLGYHIGVDLCKKGHIVTLIDISEPDTDFLEGNVPISLTNSEESNKMFFIKANIASKSELENALKMAQAEAVIHCASYGMSGKEQMPSAWDKTEEINIGGTVNVIKACCALGITSLVYTSSYNVVFGGQEIIDGDESLPYFPLHRHVDHYSRTKSVAEQLVLMADEKSGRNGKTLRTCSLRLAGLIGLKEKRHLPRIVASLPVFKFKYGYGEGLVQFVSIQNAAQAHVKALEGIISKPEVVGGQAYFISDGEPINNFEYFRPLMEKLGYSYPTLDLPISVIWLVTYLTQFVFLLVVKIKPNWAFTPFLTPAEVYKTAVTHYFTSDKAKRDFGFTPILPNKVIFDVAEHYFEKKIKDEKERISTPKNHSRSILLITVGLIIIYFLSFLFNC